VRDVNRARVLTAEVVMKPPSCRLTTNNLEEALKQMRGEKLDYGYVFDKENDFKGVITRDLLQDEIDKPGANADLSDLAEEMPTVQPDASLEDILGETLKQPYPIPVVCDEGDFRGVVSRQTMISVLAKNEDDLDEGPKDSHAIDHKTGETR
jgi:glycine betaine/proline transport system ATP-binding protein